MAFQWGIEPLMTFNCVKGMALKEFSISGYVSGELYGLMGFHSVHDFSMMTMCSSTHHNDAFILQQSLSSVFSGTLLDSRLEDCYFLNWQ